MGFEKETKRRAEENTPTHPQDLAPPEALAGGERGAGHNINSSKVHEEPLEIYVVGTSHISQQSAADVERVIRSVKPDNVVVELCRSRSGMMYAEDPAPALNKDGSSTSEDGGVSALSISGANPMQAIGRSLALGGPFAFAVRVALAKNTALASTLQNTGADFRAARRAAQEVGATLVLGDRPVEITIERAWRALPWGQRSRIVTILWRGLRAGSSHDVAMTADQIANDVRVDPDLVDR